jgi:hypothetical protein
MQEDYPEKPSVNQDSEALANAALARISDPNEPNPNIWIRRLHDCLLKQYSSNGFLPSKQVEATVDSLCRHLFAEEPTSRSAMLLLADFGNQTLNKLSSMSWHKSIPLLTVPRFVSTLAEHGHSKKIVSIIREMPPSAKFRILEAEDALWSLGYHGQGKEVRRWLDKIEKQQERLEIRPTLVNALRMKLKDADLAGTIDPSSRRNLTASIKTTLSKPLQLLGWTAAAIAATTVVALATGNVKPEKIIEFAAVGALLTTGVLITHNCSEPARQQLDKLTKCLNSKLKIRTLSDKRPQRHRLQRRGFGHSDHSL